MSASRSNVSVTISTTIAAPIGGVWSELERIEDHVEWMADAVAIDFHGDQRRGVGTSFDCKTQIGPLRTTDTMTVTEWTEGHVIGVTHRGAVTGRGRFTLSEIGPMNTDVTWSEVLEFPWWMGGPLGGFFAAPIFRWIWKRNLTRLSERVTATPAPGEQG
jgi:hypothetical protein